MSRAVLNPGAKGWYARSAGEPRAEKGRLVRTRRARRETGARMMGSRSRRMCPRRPRQQSPTPPRAWYAGGRGRGGEYRVLPLLENAAEGPRRRPCGGARVGPRGSRAARAPAGAHGERVQPRHGVPTLARSLATPQLCGWASCNGDGALLGRRTPAPRAGLAVHVRARRHRPVQPHDHLLPHVLAHIRRGLPVVVPLVLRCAAAPPVRHDGGRKRSTAAPRQSRRRFSRGASPRAACRPLKTAVTSPTSSSPTSARHRSATRTVDAPPPPAYHTRTTINSGSPSTESPSFLYSPHRLFNALQLLGLRQSALRSTTTPRRRRRCSSCGTSPRAARLPLRRVLASQLRKTPSPAAHYASYRHPISPCVPRRVLCCILARYRPPVPVAACAARAGRPIATVGGRSHLRLYTIQPSSLPPDASPAHAGTQMLAPVYMQMLVHRDRSRSCIAILAMCMRARRRLRGCAGADCSRMRRISS
ncbi:hypothetical protein B0H10DRAFT_636266 [Mycena sp. CBHHK59/15]|nr:hypothetical protein B0H10DRAFT_636266 [Mycena sp. CBHHK59/15]